VMGGDKNHVHLISETGNEDWPEMTKAEVGARLATRIAIKLKGVAC
jgi:phosphopantothenoylcysteine decarboxylase/phosphopantothenate--cysteine ligase